MLWFIALTLLALVPVVFIGFAIFAVGQIVNETDPLSSQWKETD